jgi:hypothetical protein
MRDLRRMSENERRSHFGITYHTSIYAMIKSNTEKGQE